MEPGQQTFNVISQSAFSIEARPSNSMIHWKTMEEVILKEDIPRLNQMFVYMRIELQKHPKYLFFAARNNKWSIVLNMLITMRLYHRDIQDQDGWTILHYCAVRKAHLVAEQLLNGYANGYANVYVADKYGRTALHLAALYGDLHMVKMLVEAGSSTTQRSFKGKLPLNIALEQGHKKVYDYLCTK